ncbi:MAG: hypothetical protein IT205_03005 [Fimbriimonadaceae bacterium]|nr:hypothetical protein [Fimbriimonadaceae bacterium]
MSRLFITVCAVLGLSAPALSANVALGKSVTLQGTFGTLRPGSIFSPTSLASPTSVTDGFMPNEATAWQANTVWWDAQASGAGSNKVIVDLGGMFTVNRCVLQGDNGDSYLVEAQLTDNSWVPFATLGFVTLGGMRYRDSGLVSPVSAKAFRISASGGDQYYSISEFQALEPAPILIDDFSTGPSTLVDTTTSASMMTWQENLANVFGRGRLHYLNLSSAGVATSIVSGQFFASNTPGAVSTHVLLYGSYGATANQQSFYIGERGYNFSGSRHVRLHVGSASPGTVFMVNAANAETGATWNRVYKALPEGFTGSTVLDFDFNSPTTTSGSFNISTVDWLEVYTYTASGGNCTITRIEAHPDALAATRISGNVTFADWVGPVAGRAVRITVKPAGSNTTVHEQTAYVSATGAYTVELPETFAPGTYDIYADRGQHIRRRVSSVVVTSLATSGANFVLPNGDPDNSGEVDAADIDYVISSFGQVAPNITMNADIDGSGEVDAADIDIVIGSFGSVDD